MNIRIKSYFTGNTIYVKRVLLFVSALSFTCISFSQGKEHYQLQLIKKNGAQNGMVYIRYFSSSGRHIDSAQLVSGQCSISGMLPDKMIFAKLYILTGNEKQPAAENTTDVLLEAANIRIETQKDLQDPSFSGTALQLQFTELATSLGEVKKQESILDARYDKAEQENNAPAKDKLLAEDYPRVFAAKQKILGGFIKKYPSSPLSGKKFDEFTGDTNIDPGIVEPIYAVLSDEIKAMPEVAVVKKRISISKSTAPGMAAIDFLQVDTAGNMVQLSSFHGKFVLLDFWASWCKPCRAENPLLVKLNGEYRNKGLAIISVSLDGERASWTKAIVKDGMDWTHTSDLKIFDNEVAQLYGIASIPQNVFIGPDGKIIAKNIRGGALEKMIAEKLK